MKISEIKKRTAETSPFFFSRKTLRFFGQKMSSFKIKAHTHKNVDGFLISAPVWIEGKSCGFTTRFFNPITNKLEIVRGFNLPHDLKS